MGPNNGGLVRVTHCDPPLVDRSTSLIEMLDRIPECESRTEATRLYRHLEVRTPCRKQVKYLDIAEPEQGKKMFGTLEIFDTASSLLLLLKY